MSEQQKKIITGLWQTICIIIGATISSIGIVYFIQAHNLLAGGANGTSILLSYLTPIPTSIWIAVLNIPLFFIAWRKIDLAFCIFSILGAGSLAVGIAIFSKIDLPIHVTDPLLAAIFGGIINGAGLGLVLRSRASQGGTDIISIIVRRKFSISIGTFNLYLNAIIVIILSIKFGIELGLLTLFSQYIAMRALDRVVTGLNTAKAVTIISDHSDEIADYIMKKMDRGVTFLEGCGGFGKRHKKVIWCIVTTSQLSRVKAKVKDVDPSAFIAITNASEIIGSGFYTSPV